jgi:hypothetical protein
VNYRQTTLLEQEDASTAATKTIDIDLSDIISRIQVKFNATNNGHTPTDHPAKQISKIELVDGSDVLMSLSAQQIEALMFCNYKAGRHYEMEYRNDCENRMVLDILFGTKLWDPTLALDPKRFKNPQLKITHNKALGGSAPDAATLEVFADVFDEKTPSPVGFITAKEYHSYTAGSSASNEYIDLPNDYPIRRIGIQTYKADSWWDNIVSEVELDEENKKRLPWSVDGYDLMQLAISKYGLYTEGLVGTMPAVNTLSVYVTPVEVVNCAVAGIGSNTNPFINAEKVGGYIQLNTTAVVAFRCLLGGPIPHGFVPLDCGDPWDPSDWYDVTKKGKVKLRVKAGASATVNVVLEQLRRYA